MKPGFLRFITVFVLLASVWGAPLRDARAVTIDFLGLTGNGQGILGHTFVLAGSIAHMSAFYGSNGVAGPYTRVVSPDAFDTVTGLELPLGSNGAPFGSTAAAPHGLEGVGITGPLHISVAGFTLDFNNVADLFFTSPTDEVRIYRNGIAAIFEEVSPGVFNQLASWVDAVFTVNIDYLTGGITNNFTGTLEPGSLTIFPEIWTGTSFDPIDVAGTSVLGPFGAFNATTSMEVNLSETVNLPAPGALAIFAVGLLFTGALARRRAAA